MELPYAKDTYPMVRFFFNNLDFGMGKTRVWEVTEGKSLPLSYYWQQGTTEDLSALGRSGLLHTGEGDNPMKDCA